MICLEGYLSSTKQIDTAYFFLQAMLAKLQVPVVSSIGRHAGIKSNPSGDVCPVDLDKNAL